MATFQPVQFVYICRRRSSTTNMSARRLPGCDHVTDDEVSVLGNSSSTASVLTKVTAASNPTIVIRTVWDFEKIEKRGGPDSSSKCWRCGWCGITLKGWNATKVMNHVSKAPGNNDVKACTGSIPKTTLTLFQNFRFNKMGCASVKKQHKDAFADKVSENQMSLSVMLESRRERSSTSASRPIDITGDIGGVGGGVVAQNATRLTSAIADFVYSKGLSFSVTEGDHFMQILKLSKLVGPLYRPPNRKSLANELLDLSYETRVERYMKDLDVDAEVYGLSLFGDGATVHGMPLMNILAAGVVEPSAVLAIIDCKFVVTHFIFICF